MYIIAFLDTKNNIKKAFQESRIVHRFYDTIKLVLRTKEIKKLQFTLRPPYHGGNCSIKRSYL